MMVMVLMGVLQRGVGGALSQEGEQTSGRRAILLCCRLRERRADITPLLSADLGHKLSTHMINQCCRAAAVEAPTGPARGIPGSGGRAWIPAALDRVLQSVNPPGMAASHRDNVHIAEEDDRRRDEVRQGSHESRVAGTAGPVDRTAEHGNHVADGAPAQQRRTTGHQSLQPDPQDHGTGPPQGAAGVVEQAVHDGVVAVEGNGC